MHQVLKFEPKHPVCTNAVSIYFQQRKLPGLIYTPESSIFNFPTQYADVSRCPFIKTVNKFIFKDLDCIYLIRDIQSVLLQAKDPSRTKEGLNFL